MSVVKRFNVNNTPVELNTDIYDVSAQNNGAIFESLSDLLSNINLDTLIPLAVRKGGMSIKFIQGSVANSDNKYVQARCMAQNFTTDVTQWQGVDEVPMPGSDNLVKSGGAYNSIDSIRQSINTYGVSLPKAIDAGIKGYIDKNGKINIGDLHRFSSVVYDISNVLDKRIKVTTPFTDNAHAKVWGLVLDDETTVIDSGELVSETSEGYINLFDYDNPHLKYVYVSVETAHAKTSAICYFPNLIKLTNLKQSFGSGENDVISQKFITEQFEKTDEKFIQEYSRDVSGIYDISKLVDFHTSYYIDAIDGVERDSYSTAYSASGFIDLTRVISLRMSVPKYTETTRFGYAFYDKEKNYITGGNYGNKDEQGVEIKEFSIPSTAKYIRTTYWGKEFSAYEDFFLEISTKGIIEELGKISLSFVAKGEYDITENVEFIIRRYIDAFTGIEDNSGDNNYTASNYIELSSASFVRLKLPTYNSQSTTWGYAFYDKEKKYITGSPCRGTAMGTKDAIVSVPYNAMYLRVTYWNKTSTYYSDFYCILINNGINETVADIKEKVFNNSAALFKYVNNDGENIGWNNHVNHDALEPYTSEMIEYINNSGSNFVRCTILKKDSDNNEILIPELYEYAMAGIEVLTSCDAGKNINTIKANARIILEKCDGITIINDGVHSFRYKVKYIYCMNEPYGGYSSSDPERIAYEFAIYKEFYNFVHSLRNDVKVLAGGISVSHLYMRDMCAYVDNEGKHIWDYIDIFDFHLYPQSPEGFIDSCNTLKTIMDNTYSYTNSKNFIDVPVWVTEFGFPSYNFGIEKESAYLAASIIFAFALGIEKMLVFRLCGIEDFRPLYYEIPREAFFGLVHKSLENSYISFLRNDGVYQKSIDAGDCYEKLYLDGINTPFVSTSSSSAAIVQRIISEGLVVSGAGYTIERVSIINRSTSEEIDIYNQDKVINSLSDRLILNSSLFNDIPFSGGTRNFAIGDNIMVYVKNISNTSNIWSGNRITDSYYAIKNIVRLLEKGSSIPNITDKGSYYKAQWIKPNGRNVYALWSKENIVKGIVFIDGNPDIYNIIGEKQSIKSSDTINLDISPLYFENCINVDFKIS